MTSGKQEGPNPPSPATRGRILEAAERLFLERGYHATALQEIADRVGITKPALYYHFGSKAEILSSLLEPMNTRLEQVLNDAAALAPEDLAAAREALLAGWLDVFLQFRGTLTALIRELAASIPSVAFDRVLAVMSRAIEVTAGPDAGDAETVLLAQAISAITDPIALMPHLPDDVLREHLLAGAWRLLGEPRPAEHAGRRPGGGRPRALAVEHIARARELHASGMHSAAEIANMLGVSRATIYRYLKTRP